MVPAGTKPNGNSFDAEVEGISLHKVTHSDGLTMPATIHLSLTKRHGSTFGRDQVSTNVVSPWARLPRPGFNPRAIAEAVATRQALRACTELRPE